MKNREYSEEPFLLTFFQFKGVAEGVAEFYLSKRNNKTHCRQIW